MKKRIVSILLVAAMAAVSYTHLDVYKRQLYTRINKNSNK